jgi:hypothetical protein
MKFMKKVYKIFFVIALAFGLHACDTALDINTDPNNPLNARLDQLLPTAEAQLANAFGNGTGGLSDIASQWVNHMVQRTNTNFYFMDGNEFGVASAWLNLYSGGLMDIKLMIDNATAVGANNYLGVGKLLKAYAYSVAVDVWGMAPFNDFGKGVENPAPSFDEGEAVYAQLFLLIDEAKADLAKTSPIALNGDLIYGGVTASWIKFANSLKLKLYNQVRLTNLYDATAVESLITENNFSTAPADGFRLRYGNSNNPENRHPLFFNEYPGGNNYIDPYFYLVMTGDATLNPLLGGIQDPRVPHYFYNQLNSTETAQNPVAYQNGNFLAIWFASFNIDPNEGFDQGQSQTMVGLYPCGGAYDNGAGATLGANSGLQGAGFQRLYPHFAHLYTHAELALTEGATGNPRTLFLNAMQASFAEVNEIATLANAPTIDMTDGVGAGDAYIDDVMALYDAATPAGRLELLLTQKWIASFGFGIDAYTDYRRTGYPVLFNPSTDGNPLTVLSRSYPLSFAYDANEVVINKNAPAQRNPQTDRVFWDVN